MKEILVIGGTGTIGRSVVDRLRDNDESYRLLIRDEAVAGQLTSQGVPCTTGALGDWPTVEAALATAHTVFLLTGPSEQMLELHRGLIDRAVTAGVEKIVRVSAEPAQVGSPLPNYDDHGRADEHLVEAPITHVILRPHYFMQNMEIIHAETIKTNNMFAQYLGETKIPMVDTRDIAAAAHRCLTTERFDSQTFVITGPRSISFGDIAVTLSAQLGRDIHYQNLSYEQQAAGFEAAGLPDAIVASVMGLFKSWTEQPVHDATTDFEHITGTSPTDIETHIADFARLF